MNIINKQTIIPSNIMTRLSNKESDFVLRFASYERACARIVLFLKKNKEGKGRKEEKEKSPLKKEKLLLYQRAIRLFSYRKLGTPFVSNAEFCAQKDTNKYSIPLLSMQIKLNCG